MPLTRLTRLGIPAAVLAATAVLGGAAAPRAAAAVTCTPTTSTIAGHPATTECGPATATLTESGRTYRFAGGSCSSVGSAFTVSIGTVVSGALAHNAGRRLFGLTTGADGSSGVLAAFSRGANLTRSAPYVVLSATPAQRGTFHSKAGYTPAYSGSWNCHSTA